MKPFLALLVFGSLLASTCLVYAGADLVRAKQALSEVQAQQRDASGALRETLTNLRNEVERHDALLAQVRAQSAAFDREAQEIRRTHAEISRIQRRLLLPMPGAEQMTVRALLVGIEQYSWIKESFDATDGLRELAWVLEGQGFQVSLLTNPSGIEISSELDKLSQIGAPDELGLIYLSGLAKVTQQGDVAFAAADSSQAIESWLPLSRLEKQFADTQLRGTVFVIDNVSNVDAFHRDAQRPESPAVGVGLSALPPPEFSKTLSKHLEDAAHLGGAYSTFHLADLLLAAGQRIDHTPRLSRWTFDDIVRLHR